MSEKKREWNNPICGHMGGPREYHTKWAKSDRERQISYIIYISWAIFSLEWFPFYH